MSPCPTSGARPAVWECIALGCVVSMNTQWTGGQCYIVVTAPWGIRWRAVCVDNTVLRLLNTSIKLGVNCKNPLQLVPRSGVVTVAVRLRSTTGLCWIQKALSPLLHSRHQSKVFLYNIFKIKIISRQVCFPRTAGTNISLDVWPCYWTDSRTTMADFFSSPVLICDMSWVLRCFFFYILA